MKTKILITGLALTAITTLGFAQRPESAPGNQNRRTMNSTATSSNKNCNNNENGRIMRGGKNRHVGNCNQQGAGNGKQSGASCSVFVDENKNGICDIRETSAKK